MARLAAGSLLLAALLADRADALSSGAVIRQPAYRQHVQRPRTALITLQEADLTAAAAQSSGEKRVAVSGLTPQDQSQQQQQPYVSVAPPSPPPPTFLQKARAPFMGITLVATAGISAWQSKRLYNQRQSALLDEFADTMVFHLNDERELATCLKTFRGLLGPGKYKGQMLASFLKSAATTVPVGVAEIQNLKRAIALFGVSEAVQGRQLEAAANDLSRQPSVLGKLTFLCERAMPMPASAAKLRTKFPNWSLDTVTALQRAMLENLYRELCDEMPVDAAPDPTTLEVLGLTEADARRLKEDVEAQKAAEAAAAEEAAMEAERQARMEEALLKAAEYNESEEDDAPAAPPADEVVTGASGTHEYECTKCGYILFPAAGREFKFFGDDFKCPQCGSPKDAFVDNGPVDM